MVAQPLPMVGIDEEFASSRGGRSDGALDLLYRNYAPAIRKLCQKRLGNAADAEDACHDTILRAYHALGGFDDRRAVWPWLATIAGRVCIDIERRQRTLPLHEEHATADDATREPDAEVARRLAAGLVGDAIAELPDHYRAPVYLREMEDWSYKEIAQLEQTSVAAVRSTLVRGRKALRSRVMVLAAARKVAVLPAFAPLASVRSLRDRLAARLPSRWGTTSELVATLSASVPNVANAFLVVAALGAALLPSVADAEDSGPERSAAHRDAPGAVAHHDAESTGDGTSGAGPAGSRAGNGTPRSSLPTQQAVTIDLGDTSGGAAADSDGSRATLVAKVEGRLPGDVPISLERGLKVDCDHSFVERTACDEADEFPGDE